MLRTRLTLLAPAAASALLIAGCGTTEEPAAAPSPSDAAPTGPVTVTDSRGKTITLKSPATKVVGLEWGEVEMLVGLGVMPVGVADPKGYATWVTAAPLDAGVKDVGTRGEPSVDAIVALQPDLVVMEAERGSAVVTQLEKYVPVLVTKGSDASDNIGRMRSDLKMIATATGRTAQADKLLADFDAALADGARGIAKVGVVGSGTMATGIIEVFAKAGYEVISVTRGAEKSAKVCESVKTSLNKGVVRGKLSETDRDAALGRITWSATLDHLADVDLVVEAVIEELSVKKALFASLDEICKPGVVLATTTSSLPVIDVAMATQRPADVIGLHFFNPAPIMPLVEIVQTIRTSAETSATARAVCAKLGKTGVVCGDRSGFIVNALLFPYLNDAVRMLEASYSTADDIDYAMKLGCGYPMGPFELLDVVGLDVSLAIQRELYLELREPGFAPAPLLEHLVTAGYLGRKSGRGFRDHTRR